MSYILEDIIESCHPQFLKAHNALLNTFGIRTPSDELENLWLTEYGIKIGKSSGGIYWKDLEFESKEDCLIFMLKWS